MTLIENNTKAFTTQGTKENRKQRISCPCVINLKIGLLGSACGGGKLDGD
jgi:hypothetical protein